MFRKLDTHCIAVNTGAYTLYQVYWSRNIVVVRSFAMYFLILVLYIRWIFIFFVASLRILVAVTFINS